MGLFTETRVDWKASMVVGTDGRVITGYAATQAEPHGCKPGWFAGESTLIIGFEAMPNGAARMDTEVGWEIVVPPKAMAQTQTIFLVMAAKRRFGGLHSRVPGARVEVLMNGHSKDSFSLRARATEDSDFFHRPQSPYGMPHMAPFDECGTLYAWTLEKADLNPEAPKQAVCVRMRPDASWDVDYVAILLGVRKLRVRSVVWRILELLAAAIAGALATHFFS